MINNILYHITKNKYIDDILICGLKINSGYCGFVNKFYIKEYYKKYGMQPIILTNNIEYIIKTQLTSKFIKNCSVLSINVNGLYIEDEYKNLNKNWSLYYNSYDDMYDNCKNYYNKSFICKENINLIKI